MKSETIDFGTRKLRKCTNGHTINIPLVLVKSFGLNPGDDMSLSATADGDIIIRKAIE